VRSFPTWSAGVSTRSSPDNTSADGDVGNTLDWRSTLRKAWGITLLVSGGVLALLSFITSAPLTHVVPATALCIFGLIGLRGPRAPSKMRVLDVLAVVIIIPLAPYYVNAIALSVWRDEWETLPISPRLGILGLATFSALVVSVIAILLKRSEVKQFRRQGLHQAIWDSLPYASPGGEPLSYQERQDLISSLERKWAQVKLPLPRCKLLIAAGIEPEQAKKAETRELSDEHLKTMVWLSGNLKIQDGSCSS